MANPGFTLAEDAAIKQRLSSLYVTDDRNTTRPVSVFFRYPDAEAEKVYPFVTLELVDISFSRSRQESMHQYYYTNDAGVSQSVKNAMSTMTYFPSEYDRSGLNTVVGESGFIKSDEFIPVDLTYQVSTYCRSQRHDRQLSAAMLRYVFPFRRGFIEIPEDGTIRRCDILDWRSADLLDQETGYKKRIFRKVITVQINAELPQNDITAVGKVLTVDGLLKDYNTDSDVISNSFLEDF